MQGWLMVSLIVQRNHALAVHERLRERAVVVLAVCGSHGRALVAILVSVLLWID